MRKLPTLLSLLIPLSLIACDDEQIQALIDETTPKTIDERLEVAIASNNLTGNPIPGVTVPTVSSDKSQLGMRLFFSKALGGDRDTACVTCHHPTLGGGDELPLPIGVGAVTSNLLGPGREHSNAAAHHDGGPTVPRNAPTTFNILVWDTVLFHDGRIESLGKTAHTNGGDGKGIRTPDSKIGTADPLSGENMTVAQARFPVTSPEEMKAFNHDNKDNQGIREYLASRIGNYGAGAGELSNPEYWLNLFRKAFNNPTGTGQELVTEQNIAIAIGEYERSQTFVDTPWKKYVEGDKSALSDDAKKGAELFFADVKSGGANCVSCHSGDFFTDESFHNIAMPQIGRGKGDGADKSEDFGRFRENGVATDKFAFRTPSLINVEVTGPWSHAGAYTTLEGVVKHHLNPAKAVASYDFSQLTQTGIQNLSNLTRNTQAALGVLETNRAAGLSVIEEVDLTDEQVGYLVAFLKALTDPCVKERSCLAQWIPPASEDPNGDQLDAVDQNGTTL